MEKQSTLQWTYVYKDCLVFYHATSGYGFRVELLDKEYRNFFKVLGSYIFKLHLKGGTTQISTIHGSIPHNITSDQRTHFTVNRCWKEPMTMESTVHISLRHPPAAIPVKCQNGLLKHQLGGNILWEWAAILNDLLFSLNQRLLYGAMAAVRVIHGSGHARVPFWLSLLMTH